MNQAQPKILVMGHCQNKFTPPEFSGFLKRASEQC